MTNFGEFIHRIKAYAGKETITEKKKPWGKEVIWANNVGEYTAKLLVVDKGEELSLQYHKRKNETMLILSGQIRLMYGFVKGAENVSILHSGTVIDIPNNTVHKIKAITTTYIVEVSTYDDGDVVRLQDKYNRK